MTAVLPFAARLAVGTLALAGVALAPARAAPVYSVTDIGTLGGKYVVGAGLNAGGQVVGSADVPFFGPNGAVLYSGQDAFLYSSGTITDLATFGVSSGGARSINNNGQITDGNFLYDAGRVTQIPGLSGYKNAGNASINNNGQVVGTGEVTYTQGYVTNLTPHAFLYNGGKTTDLGTLGGLISGANGINDNGQVVGYSTTSGEAAEHAFLYSSGRMTDLGTLGGPNGPAGSIGLAINASGQVVGSSTTADGTASHAFLYSNGTMIDLGSLGGASQASSINDGGQVVGQSTLSGTDLFTNRAFLYSDGILSDLNGLIASNPFPAPFTLTNAVAINDAGQILAEDCNYLSDSCRAVLLTPAATAVPEPASLALMATAVLGIALRRRAW